MGFAPDTINRLLEAADPVERPVVGGLCFTQREEETAVPSDCKLVTVNKWSPSEIDTLRSSGVTELAFTSMLSTEIV